MSTPSARNTKHPKTIVSTKHHAYLSLLKAIQEYSNARNRFHKFHKKVRERIRNGNQKEEVSDRVLQGYYSREDSEIKTLQAEAQKKLHNDKISEKEYHEWIVANKSSMASRSSFFMVLFTDWAKIIRSSGEKPIKIPKSVVRTGESITVPDFDGSIHGSFGRPSGLDYSVRDDETEDFHNRSTHGDRRYKLNDSFDLSKIEELSSMKASLIENLTNERRPESPMEPFSDLDHDVPLPAKQMDDLDISEELLENIKKPEDILVDVQMDHLVKEYEEKLAEEDNQWEAFVTCRVDFRLNIITECVNIVWKIKLNEGTIPTQLRYNFTELMEKYSPTNKFENVERNELFLSEWYSVLYDVLEIGEELIFVNHHSPEINSQEAFLQYSKNRLLNTNPLPFPLSRDYDWDTDCARGLAHGLAIYELCQLSSKVPPKNS